MKVHAIQTGSVSIKRNQTVGRGPGLLRILNTLIGREWTKRLPIYAWAIEHPTEGVIVVDTGETARSSEAGYFPYWQPYFRLAVRTHVERAEEIGPQLQALGLRDRVSKVVLTHMHTDHAGGIYHFKDTEIVVARREMRATRRPFAILNGYLKGRWPGWFAPVEIELDDGPFGPFERSKSITADGAVRVVATAGHTPGHMSVIVEDDAGGYLMIAGDTSYNEQYMLERRIDGVTAAGRAARRTLDAINRFVAENRVVYLPSHDPESAKRLTTRRATVPSSTT